MTPQELIDRLGESDLPWANEAMLCVKSTMANEGTLELTPVAGFAGMPAQEQEVLFDEKIKGIDAIYVMTFDAVAGRSSLRLTLDMGPDYDNLTGSEHIVLQDLGRVWTRPLARRLVKAKQEEVDGQAV